MIFQNNCWIFKNNQNNVNSLPSYDHHYLSYQKFKIKQDKIYVLHSGSRIHLAPRNPWGSRYDLLGPSGRILRDLISRRSRVSQTSMGHFGTPCDCHRGITMGIPNIRLRYYYKQRKRSYFDHYATLSFYYADFLTNVGPSKENKLVGEEVVLSCPGAIASLAV